MRRYQKPQQNRQEYNPWESPTIPKGAKVGVYGRQSTINQVKYNIGAGDMQIEQLMSLAKRMGVEDEDIILYIENKRSDGSIKSASGRLRIDQREGLNALVERIESDEIKAVIVFQEDRLFRDETQIEVNKFILTCQEHHCLVITSHTIYNFTNPRDRKEFRWKCEQAADFLRDYIKARLHDKREDFAMRGKYDGRAVPPGYIVDRREKINGVDNPNYKKWMEYEPHAERMQEIFDQFVAVGGKPKKLYNELVKIPVLFADFDEGVDQRTVTKFFLKKVPGGYHITFNGLMNLLTNVAYIGWWVYKGHIVKNNHPAIIPEETFWYAFNLLSDVTPEGEERNRERYRPRYQRSHKPEAPALLKDIITTNDPKKTVYTSHLFSDWYYVIVLKDLLSTPVCEKYSVLIDHVDTAFRTKLLEHMQTTKDFEAFRTYVATIQHSAEKRREEAAKDLVRIERRMQATLESLTTDPDIPQITRNALNQIYAGLEQQKQALLNPPKEETPEQQLITLLSYHSLLERLSHEEAVAEVFDDMKLLSQATTKRVALDGLSPHFLLLTIQWRTPVWGSDTALLWRPDGRAPFWTKEEVEIMREHYPTMSYEQLQELLPVRSWRSIMTRAWILGVSRSVALPRNIGNLMLSFDDKEVMKKYAVSDDELSSDKLIIWLRLPEHLVGWYQRYRIRGC